MPLVAKLSTLVVVVAVAAVSLSGCGDEEGPASGTTTASTGATTTSGAGTTSEADAGAATDEIPAQGPTDAEQVERSVDAFLVSPDSAAVCGSLSTELLESTYGDSSGCENGRPPASLAKSAEIEPVEVSGDRASATAVPSGGTYDGVEVAFELTLEGGSWTISNVEADVPVGP